jgi:plastocyanin
VKTPPDLDARSEGTASPAPSTADVADDDQESAGRALGPGLALAAAAIALVVVSLAAMVLVGGGDEKPAQRAATTLSFTIPAGAGARVDRGETLYDVFPHVLDAVVGDRLIVVNQDDRTHLIGPFTVRAGETLDYVLREPGTYRGVCTLHGAGDEAIIIVR